MIGPKCLISAAKSMNVSLIFFKFSHHRSGQKPKALSDRYKAHSESSRSKRTLSIMGSTLAVMVQAVRDKIAGRQPPSQKLLTGWLPGRLMRNEM